MAQLGPRSEKTTTSNGKSQRSTHTSPRATHHTSLDSRHRAKSSKVKGAPLAASSSASFNLSSSTRPQPTSSSINWGPATTVTSLPATGTHLGHATTASPSSGFSEGAKKAVIAATTIGGTIIVALLIYVIWRRRKGASYSELFRLDRDSDTITLATSRDGRLTALPIYQEQRYSVRSSRFGSTLSFGRHKKVHSGVPVSVAERFHRDNPWVQTAWKTAHPPTPTNESHPLNQVVTNSPPSASKRPEMVRVYSSQTGKTRMTQNTSGDSTKSGLANAINETVGDASPVQVAFAAPPPIPKDPKDGLARFSWTNLQAPPTPRSTTRSITSSLSSVPKFKRVTSWVRVQADRQATRIAEVPLPATPRTSVPTFKNKASKPNLAPKQPTRKLSKKKMPEKTLSSASRPSLDDPRLAVPAPARLTSQRPQTGTQQVDDDGFVSYS